MYDVVSVGWGLQMYRMSLFCRLIVSDGGMWVQIAQIFGDLWAASMYLAPFNGKLLNFLFESCCVIVANNLINACPA